MGWHLEGSGIKWRLKNGKASDMEHAGQTLNRIHMVGVPGAKRPDTYVGLGFDLTEAEAIARAEQTIAAIHLKAGYVKPGAEVKTIADLWPAYVRRIHAKHNHAPTERNTHIFQHHILRILGNVPLAQVNNSEYGENYVIRRREEGVEAGTIVREFVVINAVMNTAVRKGIITHNNLGKVDLPECASREVVIPIKVIEEIMGYSSRRLQRAIILALTTAQRQEKIWEMSAGRVYMHQEKEVGLTLRQDEAKTKGKGNPERLPLSSLAYAALTDGLAQLNPSMERAFTNWQEPRNLSQAFQDARDKALAHGVEYKRYLAEMKLAGITFHDLRHTANSMLLTNTALDSNAGKKLLGHSLGVHDIYSHLWDQKLRQAVDFLGEVYRPLAAIMEYTDCVMKPTTASVTSIKQHHFTA